MMKKEELIERYGEAAYETMLEQQRAYQEAHREAHNANSKKYREEHPEEEKARSKEYREDHPEKVLATNHEIHRKGGKHYDKNLEYQQTGLQGEKNTIRNKHRREYKPYKDIIAPESQIHHEWVPETAEYRGLALVEKDQHMHGFIDVIEILEEEITLLTEEEVRRGGKA